MLQLIPQSGASQALWYLWLVLPVSLVLSWGHVGPQFVGRLGLQLASLWLAVSFMVDVRRCNMLCGRCNKIKFRIVNQLLTRGEHHDIVGWGSEALKKALLWWRVYEMRCAWVIQRQTHGCCCKGHVLSILLAVLFFFLFFKHGTSCFYLHLITTTVTTVTRVSDIGSIKCLVVQVISYHWKMTGIWYLTTYFMVVSPTTSTFWPDSSRRTCPSWRTPWRWMWMNIFNEDAWTCDHDICK